MKADQLIRQIEIKDSRGRVVGTKEVVTYQGQSSQAASSGTQLPMSTRTEASASIRRTPGRPIPVPYPPPMGPVVIQPGPFPGYAPWPPGAFVRVRVAYGVPAGRVR